MRIVIVTDDFPPQSRGGAAVVAARHAQALVDRGHDVVVITTVQNRADVGVERQDGLTMHRLFAQIPERWRGYVGVCNPAVLLPFWRLLRAIRPDVIHAHNVHQYWSIAILAVARLVCPVVLTCHDVMLFHYGKLSECVDPSDLRMPEQVMAQMNYRVTLGQQWRRWRWRVNPLRSFLTRLILKQVDQIVAVSAALQQALQANGIANVRVINNGITIDADAVPTSERLQQFRRRYQLPDEASVVVMVGRLSALKGADHAIRALAIVRAQVPAAMLLMIGSHAEQYQGIEGVEAIPWMAHEQIMEAMTVADVVLVPSLYMDPFPTVILEAMACSRPVIAGCFGGASELVVHYGTGLVVNPSDVQQIASAWIDIITQPDLAARLGRAGLERVTTQFTLSQQVERYLALYDAGRDKKTASSTGSQKSD